MYDDGDSHGINIAAKRPPLDVYYSKQTRRLWKMITRSGVSFVLSVIFCPRTVEENERRRTLASSNMAVENRQLQYKINTQSVVYF